MTRRRASGARDDTQTVFYGFITNRVCTSFVYAHNVIITYDFVFISAHFVHARTASEVVVADGRDNNDDNYSGRIFSR